MSFLCPPKIVHENQKSFKLTIIVPIVEAKLLTIIRGNHKSESLFTIARETIIQNADVKHQELHNHQQYMCIELKLPQWPHGCNSHVLALKLLQKHFTIMQKRLICAQIEMLGTVKHKFIIGTYIVLLIVGLR